MEKIKVGSIAVPQFAPGYLGDSTSFSKKFACWFEASMISTCSPLFDDCDSNYEVQDKLKAAGVFTSACKPDSESCALVVNFTTRSAGAAFVKRLNAYLVEKARKLGAAREF